MVVQPPFAAPLRPPVCANGSRLGRFKRFLQPPGAPGLELVHDVFGVPTQGLRTTFSCVFEGFSRELSSHYIIITNYNALYSPITYRKVATM